MKNETGQNGARMESPQVGDSVTNFDGGWLATVSGVYEEEGSVALHFKGVHRRAPEAWDFGDYRVKAAQALAKGGTFTAANGGAK